MRGAISATLTVLVVASTSIAACGGEDRAESNSTPKASQRDEASERLIAIGLVAQQCQEPRMAAIIREDARASSRGNGKWDVTLTLSTGGTGNWIADVDGGTAVAVGTNGIQYRCDR
jgi:hypothetical protein